MVDVIILSCCQSDSDLGETRRKSCRERGVALRWHTEYNLTKDSLSWTVATIYLGEVRGLGPPSAVRRGSSYKVGQARVTMVQAQVQAQ